MTDESRPDDIEDPKPDQDEQSLAGAELPESVKDAIRALVLRSLGEAE